MLYYGLEHWDALQTINLHGYMQNGTKLDKINDHNNIIIKRRESSKFQLNTCILAALL